MKFSTLIQNVVAATALACMVIPEADAQVARTVGRTTAKTPITTLSKIKKPKFKAPARFAAVNPSDYGEVVEIMKEDFSKFATGTETEPDYETTTWLDYTIAEGGCENMWKNMKPGYTNVEPWGAWNIYPAGGTVMMLHSILDGEGHINTPAFDFTPYQGIAFLEFKARTTNPNLNQSISIEGAETSNWSRFWDDWTILGSQQTPFVTEDWNVYTAMFYGAGATTFFNLSPRMEDWWYQNKSEEASQILFDDFRVYTIKPYVDLPSELTFSNYRGNEFDLNWKEQAADYYVIDIYEVDLKTGDTYEFKTGLKSDTNTLHVTEADPASDYLFTVTAYKGDKKSFTSVPGFVIGITDPEFTEVPEFIKNEETGLYEYTSEWTDVPSAEVYNYALYHKRPAVSDGLFAVTDEDFTGIQDYDGNTTEWTIENPDFHCYGFLPLKPFKQAGWIGKSVMPFKDFIAIDGWQKEVAKKEAYIISPELDLSKDGGKFTVEAKFFGRIAGEWTEPITDIYHPETQVKAAVSLYNFDEEAGKFVQAEYFPLEDVTTAWNTFEVEFTKGSKCSKIMIEPIEGAEQVYVDDLLITQNYKKGEYLFEPCYYEFWYTYSIIDVELPETSQGIDLVEKVNAERVNPITGETISSKFAQRELGKVGEVPTGIDNVSLEEGRLVSFQNGMLNINNAKGELVKVSTIDGKLVGTSYDKAISMSLSGNNVYIVNVGNKSVKVTL